LIAWRAFSATKLDLRSALVRHESSPSPEAVQSMKEHLIDELKMASRTFSTPLQHVGVIFDRVVVVPRKLGCRFGLLWMSKQTTNNCHGRCICRCGYQHVDEFMLVSALSIPI
jgi:hypothetical protein